MRLSKSSRETCFLFSGGGGLLVVAALILAVVRSIRNTRESVELGYSVAVQNRLFKDE